MNRIAGRLAQIWNGSLRRRLILGVAGVHALLMSLFMWDVTARQEDLLLQLQAEQAEALARSVATSSAGWLAARDVAGLQEIVDAQRRNPELVFAMVLDRQGLVLAHTDPARLGQYVRDLPAEASFAVLGHTSQIADVAAPVVLSGRDVGWVRIGIGQRAAIANLATNARAGLLYTLVAVGIGALIAGFLGTRLTAKLYAIRRVSEAVRTGRRDARVPDLGTDEAGQMGSDFNHMLDALGEREHALEQESAERRRAEDALRLDIAARKESEAALRESEERFRQVVENIQEVFWMTDADHTRMLYISPGYERIWGRSVAEIYRSMADWEGSIHPEDRRRVAAATLRQREGGYDETYRILRPDGAERWVRSRAYPVREASGEIRRIVGVAEDVSDQKRIEEQFLRVQRTEAIGTLASGIAHDLNNILSPMLLAPDLLRSKLSDRRDQAVLSMIDANVRRGAAIIRQLLTFSRGVDGPRGNVQPRHLLREMGQMMEETFPRNLKIEVMAPPDLWPVLADATQIHQVLMNLCVNARDAMPDGGRLTLRGHNEVLSSGDSRLQAPAGPGRFVVLEVSDTGEGIPPGIVHRIFDPFFTTKGVGKGTGLGLSTALGIVKSHQGFVSVESEPGQGTRFCVFLPAAEEAVEPRAVASKPAAEPLGHQEMILVVDDEPTVLKATRMILERRGYRVLAAESGESAMRLFAQNIDSVRLLLTDMMMPGINGPALIRAVRELAPGIPVIATTGLDREEMFAELEVLGVTDILPKPSEPARLLHAVHDALQGVS